MRNVKQVGFVFLYELRYEANTAQTPQTTYTITYFHSGLWITLFPKSTSFVHVSVSIQATFTHSVSCLVLPSLFHTYLITFQPLLLISSTTRNFCNLAI
jgi:hypothetical protein